MFWNICFAHLGMSKILTLLHSLAGPWRGQVRSCGMNGVSISWSMGASACLALALVHLLIGIKIRWSSVHLLFAAASIAVAAIAVCELRMMLARSPAEFGSWMRWIHVP